MNLQTLYLKTLHIQLNKEFEYKGTQLIIKLSDEEYNSNEKVLTALDFLLISGKSVLVLF